MNDNKRHQRLDIEMHPDAGVRTLSLKARLIPPGEEGPENRWEAIGFQYHGTPGPSLLGPPLYVDAVGAEVYDPMERLRVRASFVEEGFQEPAFIFGLRGFAPFAEVHSN